MPHDGWGLSIADDETNDPNNPSYLPALGDAFVRLRPKVFRVMTPWNASKDPRHWARLHAVIDHVRARGVQQVIVSFREARDEEIEARVAPSVTAYEIEVAKTVRQFALKVDGWGPANEPNGGWLPTSENGPAKLTGYFESLEEVVAAWDQGALITSPDFLNHDATRSGASYATAYRNAGGGFGDVVAWHPYGAIENPAVGLSLYNEFVAAIPAGLDIWFTEAGAKPSSDQGATQQAQVSWLIDTLGARQRVKRISYYHMRDHQDQWDTALLESNLAARPAWRTWCAAVHGDNPNHSDCTGYVPPPILPASSRLALISATGSTWIKEGLPGGMWLAMGGPAAVRDMELDNGGRLVAAAGNGSVWLRQGLPNGAWSMIAGPEFDAQDVELSGGRLALVAGNGAVWLKDGLPGGPWILLGGTEFAARDIDLDGGRVAVAAGNGAVWLKDGLPGGPWILLGGTEFDARAVELSSGRLAVTTGNGTVWLKNGLPGATWLVMGGPSFATRDMDIDGTRLAVVKGDGSTWLRDGLPSGPWILLGGPEFDAGNVELGGNRLAISAGNGAVWLKNGLPGAVWEMIGGPEFGATDLSFGTGTS